MKKFELTKETSEFEGRTLYRIKALRSFGDVKEGALGGWVEKEANLSHDGDCWVYAEAKVFEEAQVYGNAKVLGQARVSGDVKVSGQKPIGIQQILTRVEEKERAEPLALKDQDLLEQLVDLHEESSHSSYTEAEKEELLETLKPYAHGLRVDSLLKHSELKARIFEIIEEFDGKRRGFTEYYTRQESPFDMDFREAPLAWNRLTYGLPERVLSAFLEKRTALKVYVSGLDEDTLDLLAASDVWYDQTSGFRCRHRKTAYVPEVYVLAQLRSEPDKQYFAYYKFAESQSELARFCTQDDPEVVTQSFTRHVLASEGMCMELPLEVFKK